jgi:hypothetical protein
MNYLKRTMLALAKTGDTEMTRLFRQFNARLTHLLTPTEIETYARYLLAPAASVAGAPPTFAEQAVCRKVQADSTAAALGKQIVAALATRTRGLHGGFGRN